MKNLLSAFIALSLVMTLNLSYANEKPGKGVKVQALHSPISEEAFQTMVLNEALHQLGYDVQDIKEVDYGAAYTSIANGDSTYMAVNWFPLHNSMYDNAGGDKVFYREGFYIEGAIQGYLIDKKTANKYKINNIAQFKNAKVAALFDTDNDGKADLTGCQAGWGCEGVIEYQLDAFKLGDRISHKQGQYAAIIADTIARYNEGDSIFYYTWTPYWVSGKLVPGKDVVWLEVPFSANPNGSDTSLSNGRNYGFDINSQRIVVNKVFAAKNPSAAKLFAVAKLAISDVSAENMLIANGEDSQKQIRQHALNWIKSNQAVFDVWLEAARKAGK